MFHLLRVSRARLQPVCLPLAFDFHSHGSRSRHVKRSRSTTFVHGVRRSYTNERRTVRRAETRTRLVGFPAVGRALRARFGKKLRPAAQPFAATAVGLAIENVSRGYARSYELGALR